MYLPMLPWGGGTRTDEETPRQNALFGVRPDLTANLPLGSAAGSRWETNSEQQDRLRPARLPVTLLELWISSSARRRRLTPGSSPTTILPSPVRRNTSSWTASG